MAKIELKNSGVVLYSDPREYRDEANKIYSGITGMIGRQLFPFMYATVPQYILDKASARGDQIHTDLQTHDMFGTVETEEQRQWAEVKAEHGIEVLNNEYIVTNFTSHATPIDKVVLINGKLCLIDVKTTAVLSKEYVSWQNSLGKMFFEIVNPHLKVDKIFVLHVKDGTRLIEVDIIADEHLQALITAEVHGDEFVNPLLPAVEIQEKALALIKRISDIEVAIKAYKEEQETYKNSVEKMFEKLNIEKWETDMFTITKTADYTRVGFDSKKFKEDFPELADKYEKTTDVKGGIRTKLKK